MKSLILNDVYNIGHNTKQMILLLLFWCVCFFSSIEDGGYIVLCAILTATMTITTFSFDEKCNWTKYAIIMPVTRENYVVGKYLVAFIFSVIGVAWGSIITFLVCQWRGSFQLEMFLLNIYAGLIVAMFFCSIWIPLLVKYGAEKTRMIMIFAIAIPIIIVVWIWKTLKEQGVVFSEKLIRGLAYASPILILLWIAITMLITIRIFRKKEF